MSEPPQATPYYLQRALAREIERLAEDLLLESPSGERRKFQVFLQNLPAPKQAEEEEAVTDSYEEMESYEESDRFFFPWCLVKLDNGGVKEPNGRQIVTTVIVFGVYDGSDTHEGYQSILTMFQRIMDRFGRNPILARQFTQEGEIAWAVQDDNEDSAPGSRTIPYQFGAMSINFWMPGYRRESRYI